MSKNMCLCLVHIKSTLLSKLSLDIDISWTAEMSPRLLCALVVLTFLFSGKARAGMDRQPEKIGKCPEPGIGICVELCSCDFDCDGKQKCCSNGCGHVCMNPVVSVKDMRKINKQACPKPFGNGTCDQLCEKHKDCECDQKCCFNGCGNECMDVTWDYDCDYTYKCGGKIGKECPPGFMCKLPFEGVDVRGVCCKDRPQMPDCSKVICPKPNCPNAYTPEGKCCPECPVCDFPCPEPACSNPVFPPGECCPKCEPDCSAVVCPLPKCQNPFTPVGECCPICPDCSNVVCPMLKCQNSYVPPGECCAVCVPDCSAVQCMEPDCQNSYTPEGQCCPICPDCRLVICPAIFCEDFFYPPGECCPKCVPDCSEVVCNPVSCLNPFTPKHECCPICPDCSNVACPLIYCEDPVYPPGACCPLCPPDCSEVLCPKPPCSNSYIPDGECCAVCPDCSLVLCQPIFCEIQYIPKGECCAQCIPGCCTYKNRKYKAGERFQDDCNICICHDDGSVSCTKRNCVTCTYKGKTYKAGESFPDDCNTCTCNEDGNVACTLKYCVPCQYKKFTYESGTKFAVKCNTCTCSSGSVGCTEKACIGLCANGQKPLPKAICGGKKDLKCRKKGYQCDFSNVVGEVEDPLGICCKVQKCPNGLKALSYTYCDDDLVCPNGYTCEDSNDKKGPSKICCLDCTNVTCPKPPCRGCYTTDCQCCPICPGYCLFNGKYYKAGKSFDVDCNTCTCGKNGGVICTDAYCPPCEYEGVVYESGTSFNVKCNKCKCSSGKISCTKKSCDGLCANGLKPLPDEDCGGIAGLPCKTEGYECDYSNVPKGGADFFGICCKALVCPNGLKPLSYTLCSKGMVCPNKYTCEAPAEGIKPNGICCLDCSNVKCAKPECNNSYVPEGQCCPICPGGCIVDGVVYQPGESYFADCNRCTCGKGGLSICTLMACGPACYREGRPYKDGEKVPTDNPCESCTCFYDNTTGEYEIVCAQIGCPPPPCEFPRFKKDVCCPICDGTCTVDGVTYEDGEHFYKECNKCYCNNGLPVCTLMGCEPGCYKEGIRYIDGETVPSGDPCVNCTCHEVEEDKFEILCSSVGCPPIPCKFPRYIKDVCCPVCDGTCTVDGVIYQDGESFFKECNKCTCTNGVPICTLKGCLPGCYKDGERYEDGDIIETDDPCEHCECLLQDGEYRIDCAIQGCPKPICDNPRFPEGECCGICDGCLENGVYYEFGETVPDRALCEINCICAENGFVACAIVDCPPFCENPQYVEGQCCPICVPDGYCFYKGEVYEPGEKFPDDCNTCFCAEDGSGSVGCTEMFCVPCTYEGVVYDSGTSFRVQCNTCTCSSGNIKCTEMSCGQYCGNGLKPLPNDTCGGIAGLECKTEGYECDFSNVPDGGADFFGLCCKVEVCPSGLKPLKYTHCDKNLVCPQTFTCEPSEGAKNLYGICCKDCSTVKCGRPVCEDPFIPDGECCPICPKPCVEDGIIYQSGQPFFRECNRCKCINGMAGCTKLYCLPGCYRNGTRYDKGDEVPGNNPCEKDCKCYLEGSKYKIGCDVDLCEESCAEDGIIIPSGERFYRKCNRCVCRNGLAKCTRKACPPGCYRDGIRHEEGEDVTTNNPCEKNCKCYLEGEEYKIGCDADSCEKPCIEDGIIYPSGETFYRECNTCKCKNGLAGCTKKACAPGCYRNGKHYEKGEGVPSNNPCERNCKCYLEGNKYRIGCDINSCEEPCLENGIVYQSGETFFRECNRCTCRNGLAACTKIGCFPGCYRNGIRYDEGDDVKSNSPCEKKCKCYLEDREYKIGCHVDSCEESCVEDGIIYPSGETFYQECNTCTCGNGLAGCTKIGCRPGCYRNGSRYDKGDEVPGHDPCEKCTCYLENREYKINCDISSCKKPCVEDGIIYQSGETFYRECNTCKCNNGLAGCTKIACADGCYRNGTRYDEGDEVERNNECERNCKCYLRDDKYEIGCEVKECEEPCIEDGIIYQSGETFYRECNKCTCKDGLAGCTKIGCPPGCYRNGTPYEEGDIVPSNYPCEKKCRCFLEGDKYKIGCDIEGCKKPCVEGGIIYQSGETFFRECNRCQCENGKAGCTRIACAAGCYRNGTRYEKGEDVESNNQCEKRCECFLEGSEYRIGCDIAQCGEPCVEDGLIYQSGESFYRECNICRCRNGLVGCTKIYCAPGCYRNRIRYDQGDGVPSNNPCEKRCKCFLEGKQYKIGCDMEDCKAPCIVNGTSYPSGTSFWDQCNACFCANGAAGCTLMLCAPGCYRNGKRYDKGDDVPSDDPCEKNCKCYLENREYVIKCDIEKCPPIICKNPRYVEGECCPKCDLPCFVNGTLYPHGSTFWDECNKCSCSNGLASCTEAFCPPGCYKDGKRYELGDQVPGDNPCEVCYCTGRYEIFCAIIDCVFPLPCTKPIYMENECCPICPPGCVDSDGKFYKINDEIPTGSPCEFCYCAAPNSIACNLIECAAPPCPNPVVKPDECCPICELVCYDENGNGYFPGQEIPDNDPCKSCFCQEDGRILCSAIGCALPFPCEDIFTPPGECCPVCREGCSKDGVLYKEGDEVPDPDPCKTCRCTENHVICISRICPPLPCDNTVHREGECCPVCLQDGCTDDASGVYYPIGQIVLRIDPCSRCFCNRSCFIDCRIKVECAQPRCDNPVSLPGNCCPYCDTGSCEYKGHTFKAGEKLEIGCCTCECRFGEAQCSCIHCPPCPTDPDDLPLPPALKCCGCT